MLKQSTTYTYVHAIKHVNGTIVYSVSKLEVSVSTFYRYFQILSHKPKNSQFADKALLQNDEQLKMLVQWQAPSKLCDSIFSQAPWVIYIMLISL